MSRYRKKPVVIDAVKWEGKIAALDQLPTPWAEGITVRYVEGMPLAIATLEGTMTAELGDWVIRGVKGELYPCKPDIFAETYDSTE